MTRFLAEQLSTAHWFDQRETRELLNWAPAVSLDEGLARLAGHYGSLSAAALPDHRRGRTVLNEEDGLGGRFRFNGPDVAIHLGTVPG